MGALNSVGTDVNTLGSSEPLDPETGSDITETPLYIDTDSVSTATSITHDDSELVPVPDEKLEELQRLHGRTAFCTNLMILVFSQQELIGRNCRGIKKPALNKTKLAYVKNQCKIRFPAGNAENFEVIWRQKCVKALDSRIRALNRRTPNNNTGAES